MDPDILIYECLVLSFNVPSLIHQRSSPSYLPLLSQAGKKYQKQGNCWLQLWKAKHRERYILTSALWWEKRKSGFETNLQLACNNNYKSFPILNLKGAWTAQVRDWNIFFDNIFAGYLLLLLLFLLFNVTRHNVDGLEIIFDQAWERMVFKNQKALLIFPKFWVELGGSGGMRWDLRWTNSPFLSLTHFCICLVLFCFASCLPPQGHQAKWVILMKYYLKRLISKQRFLHVFCFAFLAARRNPIRQVGEWFWVFVQECKHDLFNLELFL